MNLLLQWEESLEQGHELLPQSLCAMSPHLETELRQRIEILRGTKWLSEDAPAWDDFTPGGVLANRYHLESLIAHGGFSIVWRGFDVNLKRTGVLKLPETPHPDAGDRIQREAYRMARLRHPSILTVYDLLRTPSSSCL